MKKICVVSMLLMAVFTQRTFARGEMAVGSIGGFIPVGQKTALDALSRWSMNTRYGTPCDIL